MKRSPLPARTAPLKRTPIKRKPNQFGQVIPTLQRTPVRKKRPGPARRVSVVRDKGFLEVLRFGVCEVARTDHGSDWCQLPPFISDPAHGPVNGFGSKGGDDGAISLCRTHHREQHRIGWPAFEKKYVIDRARIAAEHYARYKQEAGK